MLSAGQLGRVGGTQAAGHPWGMCTCQVLFSEKGPPRVLHHVLPDEGTGGAPCYGFTLVESFAASSVGEAADCVKSWLTYTAETVTVRALLMFLI